MFLIFKVAKPVLIWPADDVETPVLFPLPGMIRLAPGVVLTGMMLGGGRLLLLFYLDYHRPLVDHAAACLDVVKHVVGCPVRAS